MPFVLYGKEMVKEHNIHEISLFFLPLTVNYMSPLLPLKTPSPGFHTPMSKQKMSKQKGLNSSAHG